jgi:hypothetical protein
MPPLRIWPPLSAISCHCLPLWPDLDVMACGHGWQDAAATDLAATVCHCLPLSAIVCHFPPFPAISCHCLPLWPDLDVMPAGNGGKMPPPRLGLVDQDQLPGELLLST